MLFSETFKRFTEKASATLQPYSPSLPETFERERAAALAFLPILRKKLATADGRLHAGTVLSAAAWLAGTSLYRSLHFQEAGPAGTLIKSEELNREWERLILLLEDYHFHKTDIPVGRVVLAAMAAPHFFKPQVEILSVQRELQDPYNNVMRKHGFDYRAGARVGVVLCSLLIQQYSAAGLIDQDAAAGIVAQGIFEGARTVPPC